MVGYTLVGTNFLYDQSRVFSETEIPWVPSQQIEVFSTFYTVRKLEL